MAKRSPKKRPPNPEHRFVKFPKGLLDQKNLTHEGRSVLVGILAHAWEPDDQCFASAKTIGKHVNMSESATYRALKLLIENGFLIKEPRRDCPSKSAYRVPSKWWAPDVTTSEHRSKIVASSASLIGQTSSHQWESGVPPVGIVSSHQWESGVPPVGPERDSRELDPFFERDAKKCITLSNVGGNKAQGNPSQQPKGKKAITEPPQFRGTPPQASVDVPHGRPGLIDLLKKLGRYPQTFQEMQSSVEATARFLAEHFSDDHSFERYCKLLWPFAKGDYWTTVVVKAWDITETAVAEEKVFANIGGFFCSCLENLMDDKRLTEDSEFARPVDIKGFLEL